MKRFSGCRILMIANRFFGIEDNIRKSLEAEGATVDYFDERPGNGFLVKALIRVNSRLIKGYVNRYHERLIEAVKGRRYDYIFFIKGESFSYRNLESLLRSHSEAVSIVYHWDSIVDNANALNLLELFDRKFSFDPDDCRRYDMSFLPLFYYDEYACLDKERGEEREEREDSGGYKYDLLFVGTAHNDRYRIISDVASQFKNAGKRCFIYFFFQGKIMFYKYLVQHKEARNIDKRDVHFKPVEKRELLKLYDDSRIIVDVNKPRQGGLTLRTIEALGAGRKLITTNRNVVDYDFYNPSNILVIDAAKPIVPEEFMETAYEPVEKDIYEKYSLSSWLKSIFQ